MTKLKRIITNNREIYEKFNMLNFSSEVLLKGIKPIYINRIVSNLNKPNKIVDMTKFNDYTIIKKLNPVKFSVYYRRKGIL